MKRTRNPIQIQILSVVKPLPRCTQWSGEAKTPRRSYQWFYSADTGRLAVMAQQPEDLRLFFYLRRVPSTFKAKIKRAVRSAQGASR